MCTLCSNYISGQRFRTQLGPDHFSVGEPDHGESVDEEDDQRDSGQSGVGKNMVGETADGDSIGIYETVRHRGEAD